jgi:hypothetical protein
MIALLTNERIAAKKPGLGFLNPLLYANPGAFNDMKTGTDPNSLLAYKFLKRFLREQSRVQYARLQCDVWLGSGTYSQILAFDC